jgi:hypothetical protein
LKKAIFCVVAAIVISFNFAYAQDSVKSIINTKTFDITTDISDKVNKIQNRSEFILPTKIFSECNKLTLINDSCFNVVSESGNDLILYKNITNIGFYVHRRTLEGMWKGALTGLVGAVFTTSVAGKSIFKNSDGGGFIQYILVNSLFILTGTAIGGTIGYFSFDTVDYDIQKYPKNYRKDVALSLFLKYSVKL